MQRRSPSTSFSRSPSASPGTSPLTTNLVKDTFGREAYNNLLVLGQAPPINEFLTDEQQVVAQDLLGIISDNRQFNFYFLDKTTGTLFDIQMVFGYNGKRGIVLVGIPLE